MNFLKRALASVTRRKGKSIILFAVVFILGNVIAGAISIQQATGSVEKNIKQQLGGTATVTVDYEKYQKDQETDDKLEWPKSITVKEIEAIASLSYVKYYDYSVTNHIGLRKFNIYEDEEMGVMMGGGITKYIQTKGVNYPEITDIKEKKIELAEGRVFEQAEIDNSKPVALISAKIAELNNLKVGDTMVLDNTTSNEGFSVEGSQNDSAPEYEYYTQDQAYEVVGIFNIVKQELKADKPKNEEANWQKKQLDLELFNTIYTTNGAVTDFSKNFLAGSIEKFPELKEMMINSETGEIEEYEDQISPVFVLKSPEDAESFKEEATPLIENKYNKLLLSTDQYDSIAGPVKGMSKIASYVIIVAVGATLLIISLVVLLFLRDRKHELGIYLSLGEKRGKVIAQILIEVLVVAFVAITLSVFTGNLLAKGISSSLVESQLNAENSGDNYDNDTWELQQLTGNNIDSSDVADSYEISLSLGYVAIFYVVGLGTILLSTVVPLIYILRLNPKKIMM